MYREGEREREREREREIYRHILRIATFIGGLFLSQRVPTEEGPKSPPADSPPDKYTEPI